MINRHQRIMTAGLTVLGASVVGSCVHADPFLPVPPASFLNYHVSTARGLSEEVAQDVVVRARLARHFRMSAPAVASYVRENLVETTLTARQAGRYRVACISPSGREYFVSERLAAGTPVFALANTGQPILKLECGNPLVAALPVLQAKKPVHKVGDALLATDATVPGVVDVASSPMVADASFTTNPALAGYEFAGGPAITNVGGSLSSLGGFGFLPGLLGAAALVGLATGHNSNDVLATPEPGVGVILAMGGLAVGALCLRASRRKATAQ